MRIVVTSTKDHGGGAYIAAYRQFKALKSLGADINLVVLESFRNDKGILEENNPLFRLYNCLAPRIDSLPKLLTSPRKDKALCWVPNRTVSRIKNLNPDIVQVHSFNEGLMRIEDLAKFNKPIVWTLHDAWALGGADHLPSDDDKRYILGFGERISGEQDLDLDKWVFNRKLKTVAKIKDLTIVCPSSWLYKKAKESKLFSKRQLELIPNPIDTQEFSPINKVKARNKLGLPKDKILVGFGALAGSGNSNKGFDLLLKSLDHLAKKYHDEIELVVFGDQKDQINLPFKAHFLGSIFEEAKLGQVYSSLDVFVVPSRLENLPYSAMEALACAIPVVAFKTGGLPDLVDNEFLAHPFDTKDLASKIDLFVSNQQCREKISKQVRKKVENNYNYKVIGKKYLALYENLS